jgi:toxin ParE1/3/4
MAKFWLSNKAVEDLEQIWNYTFDTWSEQQADKYYRMLIDTCGELAENPSVGKNYDGVYTQLLGFNSGRHIIFYRATNSYSIEIIRILHERMDLKHRIIE